MSERSDGAVPYDVRACVCVLTRIICGHKCALANNPLHVAGLPVGAGAPWNARREMCVYVYVCVCGTRLCD